uniref:Uncharacterized protein n=1 Tax=Romanomermis culicivorax TaxID=13658 RepID=A0A915IQZ0_ROMCU
MKNNFCLSVSHGNDLSRAAVIFEVENCVDVGKQQKIGPDDTLIITIIVKDDALYYVFPESGLH